MMRALFLIAAAIAGFATIHQWPGEPVAAAAASQVEYPPAESKGCGGWTWMCACALEGKKYTQCSGQDHRQ